MPKRLVCCPQGYLHTYMTQFLSAKHKTNGSLYSSINEELDKVPTSPIYELIIACLYNVYICRICRASCWHGPWGKLSQHAHFSTAGCPSLQPRLFGKLYIYICMLTNVRWKKAERIYVVFGAVIEIINAAISIWRGTFQKLLISARARYTKSRFPIFLYKTDRPTNGSRIWSFSLMTLAFACLFFFPSPLASWELAGQRMNEREVIVRTFISAEAANSYRKNARITRSRKKKPACNKKKKTCYNPSLLPTQECPGQVELQQLALQHLVKVSGPIRSPTTLPTSSLWAASSGISEQLALRNYISPRGTVVWAKCSSEALFFF